MLSTICLCVMENNLFKLFLSNQEINIILMSINVQHP
jgi:hypothetical protein